MYKEHWTTLKNSFSYIKNEDLTLRGQEDDQPYLFYQDVNKKITKFDPLNEQDLAQVVTQINCKQRKLRWNINVKGQHKTLYF